jgi:hypothetical protein
MQACSGTSRSSCTKNRSFTEQKLYGRHDLDDHAQVRLDAIRVELDQCWDLLRQRRALRDAGQDPDRAQVRPASVVEKYTQ